MVCDLRILRMFPVLKVSAPLSKQPMADMALHLTGTQTVPWAEHYVPTLNKSASICIAQACHVQLLCTTPAIQTLHTAHLDCYTGSSSEGNCFKSCYSH